MKMINQQFPEIELHKTVEKNVEKLKEKTK